jgi:hypothetical protein
MTTDAAGIHNGSNSSPDMVPPLLIGSKDPNCEHTRNPRKRRDAGLHHVVGVIRLLLPIQSSSSPFSTSDGLYQNHLARCVLRI